MLKWPRRNCVQITCNTSNICHMQHVAQHATWYEGTAQLLSLTELKSHLFALFFYFIGWTSKPMKEGRKPEYPPKKKKKKKPWWRASEYQSMSYMPIKIVCQCVDMGSCVVFSSILQLHLMFGFSSSIDLFLWSFFFFFSSIFSFFFWLLLLHILDVGEWKTGGTKQGISENETSN